MKPPVVLVADEDSDTRLILRALLERGGFTVVDAGSSGQAVELAQSRHFSLVILNHPMRVEEHVTLTGWLRKQPATQSVPIINLTSRAVPSFMDEARTLGVSATMPKPIDVQRLLQLVHDLTAPHADR